MSFAVVAFIVFMERAQRRLLITYPKRQHGNRIYEGQTSFLPLKLNTSGVIPPIFASSLLLLADDRRQFLPGRPAPGILATISAYLGHGRPLYMLAYVGLIVFFAFFYTAIVFNPAETADNLKKHGGFIPGIRPGRAHGAIHRRRADADHGARRGLSRDHLPLAGIADLLCRAAVLFRRHVAADRRQRDDGYGGADPRSFAGASI